ncbi:MAG TPA: WD40 repeat domain-containing protein [Candidatus Limnocylindria bacterium]
MSDEQRDDERVRGIIGRPPDVAVPPFEALRRAPARSPRRSVALTLATVIVAVVALYAGQQLSTFRQQQASPTTGVAAPSATAGGSPTASPKVVLPQPIPQPVTRTSAAAQVAWLATSAQDGTAELVGVDPRGAIVARMPWAEGRPYRSADGTLIVIVADDHISTYSALDGSKQRTYPRQPTGGVIDVAFSPDGRWMAFIGAQAYVQVIDLRSGLTQTTPLASDPNAATPGMSGTVTGPIWSTLVFARDSARLYTIIDWGGPLRLTAFTVTPTGLAQTATAVAGIAGAHLPTCSGPGLATRVLPDGGTLMAFCNYDGDVWIIDLATLTEIADIRTGQTNPFEQAPIFTPDGQLVYLRSQSKLKVFDVRTRSVLGPAFAPKTTSDPGPFSWLLGQANAGYVAPTIPVSPDGTKLYWSGSGGIEVLRIPDLKLIGQLSPSLDLNEVWVSGDGKTLYATGSKNELYVVPEAGGAPITVPVNGVFFASEHG